MRYLRIMFGRQLTVLDDAGERVTVRIGGQSTERIAAQIAGFGATITVQGPPEALACLARIGQELTATYG